MIKPVHHAPVHHAAAKPFATARDAFNALYDANQADNVNKRPGWPDAPGATMKLSHGAELHALGLSHLPKGSKAAETIHRVTKEGVDGDQSAYTLKLGKQSYLVVGSFPEDASRDQLWLFDAKGQKLLTSATPNDAGKLRWR